MGRFIFCQRWLVSLGVLLALAGLSVALLCAVMPVEFLNRLIDPVFWGQQPVPKSVALFQRWTYGVMMATMAGWGVFIALVAHYPFRKKEKWAWTCMAAGVLVWYIPDTSLSLSFGVIANALGNTILLIAVVIPLLITRHEFFG